MDSWLKIGANENLSLQALAVAFFADGHNPFKPPAPGPPPGPTPPGPTPPPVPPPPPQPLPDCNFTVKESFCARSEGTPVLSTRLHTSQITCCRLCMANPACKSWTLDSTNASACACYLQAIVNDPSKGHAATGCTSGVPPPPPAPAPPPPPPPPPQTHGSLTCQDNQRQPMMPIYHIIGNVSQSSNGSIELEAINDVSGVTYYEGLYHV